MGSNPGRQCRRSCQWGSCSGVQFCPLSEVVRSWLVVVPSTVTLVTVRRAWLASMATRLVGLPAGNCPLVRIQVAPSFVVISAVTVDLSHPRVHHAAGDAMATSGNAKDGPG